MKVEVYVPVLIKFSDDRVVFSDNVINQINSLVFENFKKNNELSLKYHFEYFLKDEMINELVDNFKNEGLNISPADILGEFYYYHHRIIIKIRIEVPENFDKLRIIRSVINDFYPKLIIDYVFDNINKISEVKAISFYSYMMVFIPNNKYQLKNYTDKLGSVTFSIIESTNKFLAYSNTHYIRISIPSLIVYHDKEISNDIKVDLINLIYQNLLYEKKLSDKDLPFSSDINENVKNYNYIDESKLTLFWNNTMEMLGGKISERQSHNIARQNFYITIIGLFISIIVLGQTIYDYFGLRFLQIYSLSIFILLVIYSIVRFGKSRVVDK
ncbi:hypothetical protein J2Z76_000104 [Sedimentibacter acidaminivorans]|uniref:Uncharacterized protein n=1 Tax=Sedimentibacter acidaminivorans TaxID=913099 RepID=A0ABS4G989_9FIRM|nr:hypothetical protein [Sedimentibacter acidaminivorans]MBP1924251.1 hypothetical protein [Sedimentibacter acidaminivorans]